MADVKGRHIGLLVTETPITATSGPVEAIRKAENIRKEMAAQIADMEALFAVFVLSACCFMTLIGSRHRAVAARDAAMDRGARFLNGG